MSYSNSNMEIYSAQDFKFNSLGTHAEKKITLKLKENQAGVRLLYTHINFKKIVEQYLPNLETKICDQDKIKSKNNKKIKSRGGTIHIFNMRKLRIAHIRPSSKTDLPKTK